MADVFISYAREDLESAQALAHMLEARGWNVWWDRELVPGNRFDEVIEREITAASAVIVLWSKVSVASPWVRSEANAAVERGVLIPVLLDGTNVPLRFRIVQAVDLTGWDGTSGDPRLASLLSGVDALAGPPRPPGQPWQPPPQPPPGQPSEPVRTGHGGTPAADQLHQRTQEMPVGPAAPVVPPPRKKRNLPLIAGLAGILVIGVIALVALLADGDDDGTDAPDATDVTAVTSLAETTTTGDGVDPTDPSTDPDLILAFGDEGPEVGQIQQWLVDAGIAPELEVDQIFGPLTEQAVLTFERDNGLPEDGRLVIEGDEWQLLRATAEHATGSTTTEAAPDGDLVTVPDVLDLTAELAVAELETMGFEADLDAGCSNSVGEGRVRQVSYVSGDEEIVVVGKASEIEAPGAPVGALLRVLVSTGPCSS